MPGNIGPLEIIIVLIIALIVFGPKRLPELGSSLGRGIREFKETITGDRKDDDDDPDDDVKALSASATTTAPAESADSEAAHDKRG
ncbi:MAG: twin-arginine translocase TatA/TatE family subunit [Solirubrobacterales bacterium]